MKILLIITIIIALLQVLRVSIYILRKDTSLIRKIFELIILILMIILTYYNLINNESNYIYLSLLLSLYTLINFIYERLFKNEYISVLSVKKGIDASDTGILFLDNKNNIILINNLFHSILKELNITNDYINNLIKKSFKKIDNDYLLKYNNKIYMLKIFNNEEISLIDITELYMLQEEEKNQNKKIRENNNKLLLALKNIESLEKEKNLLKLKNEYHDIIGYRLALFNKYLEQESKDKKDALFLLDSIYEDFNTELSSEEKLNNLIKMYHVIGININVFGSLPLEEETSLIFFEIIRESITNAITHADSKNIKVVITMHEDYIEMIITNDGKRPDNIIFENEGIKGMRKKLSKINGNLKIITDNIFTLIVRVEQNKK